MTTISLTKFQQLVQYTVRVCTLQMKGWWESNRNVWFPFRYSQKWNCYFQIIIIMFCLQVPTLIYLWEIYIFPGSVWLFCCRKICGPILGIHKSLTDTWMWKLGLRPFIPRKGIHIWDYGCNVYALFKSTIWVIWLCFPPLIVLSCLFVELVYKGVPDFISNSVFSPCDAIQPVNLISDLLQWMKEVSDSPRWYQLKHIRISPLVLIRKSIKKE